MILSHFCIYTLNEIFSSNTSHAISLFIVNSFSETDKTIGLTFPSLVAFHTIDDEFQQHYVALINLITHRILQLSGFVNSVFILIHYLTKADNNELGLYGGYISYRPNNAVTHMRTNKHCQSLFIRDPISILNQSDI